MQASLSHCAGLSISSVSLQPGRVYLTDCKSKFGTSVNKRKLSANERVELHGNDIIKFGQGPIHNTSRFKYVHKL